MPVCVRGTCPGHGVDDDLPFGNFTGAAFESNGALVYAVDDLRLDGTEDPCDGTTTRWVPADDCSSAVTDAAAAAASSAETGGLRDVIIGEGCAVSSGAVVDVSGECWRHVHSHHHNVYDFTRRDCAEI